MLSTGFTVVFVVESLECSLVDRLADDDESEGVHDEPDEVSQVVLGCVVGLHEVKD